MIFSPCTIIFLILKLKHSSFLVEFSKTYVIQQDEISRFLTDGNIYFMFLQEISTVEEEVIEFTDDRNQLVWFLQPNEAQFYLAAETLKYKPKPFGRTKSPFTPKHGHSPRASPQISPAGSDPDLRMNVHVDGHVDSSSDDSEDATQKNTSPQAREDRDPKGTYKKVAGGKKKRDVINKIKHALCHVPRH